jgi:glycosyltransferase involved in cell wall biosynthesis
MRALRDLARRVPEERCILHTYFFWPLVYGRILKRLGRVSILVENREDTGFRWGPVHHWILRRLRMHPDLIICVSNAVRDASLESEGLPPAKVVVVENGVRLPSRDRARRQGARRELGVEAWHVLVGMVANLNLRVKAVDRFLDAIPEILASAPDARFVIAGEGRLRPDLERQAKQLGIDTHLRFLGHVSDMSPVYEALDVSVLTSQSEGLSITLLESMAYAIPVVVTAVGGNVDVVIDGDTGYLVPPDDAPAFASAVVALCSDSSRRSRLGDAGRRRCEERYDVRSVSGRYESLYAGLIAKATPPSDRGPDQK